MKHILTTKEITSDDVERIFKLTDRIRTVWDQFEGRERLSRLFPLREMQIFFYQESTRTRLSFEKAGRRLGMNVFTTTDARRTSSVAKGESLEHSIKILCSYETDVIVLRHPENGAAVIAAEIADTYGTRIINAGDGSDQHPTQSLLDLYAIKQRLGRLDNFTITLGGDLALSRTIHSLAYLLGRYKGIKVLLVSHPEIRLKPGITEYFERHGVAYAEVPDLKEAFRLSDIVYWTRIQEEHYKDTTEQQDLYRRVQAAYTIGHVEMTYLGENAFLMHPLPINGEIKIEEVDADPKAYYIKQASYGPFLRMALLCDMFQVELP